MKGWRFLLGLAGFFLFVPANGEAQTLIAQYYRCDTADEGEADFIMNTVFAPILDKHADAGNITGWGWVEHAAGGPWRRIGTLTAPDRAAAVNMWAQINQELEDEHPGAVHRFNEICGSHDDYFWNLSDSSDGTDPGATPDAWVSTYWVCNQTKESRADEIQQQISSVYDRHVAAGNITGWSWYTHDLGGRFRRLLTVAGSDFPSVLDARDMIINELQTEHAEAMAEFGSICSGHVDYLWQNGRSEG
jgi:hypothetical protein